jgi:hypothetical protein
MALISKHWKQFADVLRAQLIFPAAKIELSGRELVGGTEADERGDGVDNVSHDRYSMSLLEFCSLPESPFLPQSSERLMIF